MRIDIILEPREDDGLRAYSDALPGLALSHCDPERVFRNLGPAIQALLSWNGGIDMVEVEVVERRDAPGAWSVETVRHDRDGEVQLAIFHGPGSKQRAVEYAGMKWGDRWRFGAVA